jgi:hypothetical protein
VGGSAMEDALEDEIRSVEGPRCYSSNKLGCDCYAAWQASNAHAGGSVDSRLRQWSRPGSVTLGTRPLGQR